MKILELCLSPGFGGLELYAQKIIRHLSRPGVECHAVISRGSFLDRQLQEAGIPHTFLRTTSRYLPILAARKLAQYIDAHGIEVIHMHWGGDLALAVLGKRFSRRSVRLVYTRQMAVTRSKNDWYHRFQYRHVDSYVVITRRLQEEARRLLPLAPERIQLLYYGVAEPGPHDPVTCREFLRSSAIRGDAFKIALFGRIEHGKGQHVLVEAVRRLTASGYDIQVALVGHIMNQGYFDGLMGTVAGADLQERIRYLGFHDNPQAVMGCFDVVVLTTQAETFGLVLIEAMRAGTAVIGTDAGGVPEIIKHGETGILVKPGEADSLAEAIEQLIKDPELKARLAQAGKREADVRFSEERHFQRLEEILTGPV